IGIYWFTRPSPPPTDGDGNGDGNGGPPPEPNKLPVALAWSSETLEEIGTKLTFSATDSYDSDGNIVTYEWNFGDGTTATGEVVTHEYEVDGDYIVTLMVEDDEGEKTTNHDNLIFINIIGEKTFPTMDSPPIAKVAVDADILTVGEKIELDGTSSNGWMLSRGVPAPDLSDIIEYKWDFGDGTSGNGGVVEKTFDEAGSYAVELVVKSEETGKTDNSIRTIYVSETEVSIPDIKNPDTFIYATALGLGSGGVWDPLIVKGGVARSHQMAYMDTLVWYPPGQTEIKPLLADSYEISEDAKTYTFYLREGVTFWNGDEVTAEDVQWSIWRFMVHNLAGTWCEKVVVPLTGIGPGKYVSDELRENSVEVLDKYTVRFNLPKPDAAFLETLTLPNFGVLNKEYAIERGSWKPGMNVTGQHDPGMDSTENIMGCGAYKIAKIVPQEMYVFERFDEYYRGTPEMEKMIWLEIQEFSTRKKMLENGDIDATAIEASQIPIMSDSPGVSITSSPYGFTETIFFGFDRDVSIQPVGTKMPTGGDLFGDVHMRKGIAYAFPYEEFIKQAWLGMVDEADGLMIPGYLGAFPFLSEYDHDLAKAEEEFKLAWDGKIWEEGFTVTYGYQPWMAQAGQISGTLLKEALQSINPKFDLILIQQSYPTLLTYPLWCAWSEAGPDPVWYNKLYRSGWYYSTFTNYKNEEIDVLLDQALAISDPEKRNEIYKQATDLMGEEVAIVTIDYTASITAYRDWLHGVDTSTNMAWHTHCPLFSGVYKK
ncbi:ABC transporter substrate-binding protein, partial [Thermoproteota archaeon]